MPPDLPPAQNKRRWMLTRSHPMTTTFDGPRLALGESVEVAPVAEMDELLNIINVAAEYLRDPERDLAEGRALAALALDKAGEVLMTDRSHPSQAKRVRLWALSYGALWAERVGDFLAGPWYRLSRRATERWFKESR